MRGKKGMQKGDLARRERMWRGGEEKINKEEKGQGDESNKINKINMQEWKM